MISRLTRSVFFIILMGICSPAFSGSVILGVNLDFVDGKFSDEASDLGLGIHVGYEFQEWKNWQFGALFEYLDGWNNQEDLNITGEMMYDSKSLYATARPNNWPIMFKAGIVDADYKVLQQDITKNLREVSDTGFAYGGSLVLGFENFRIDILDVKRIKIGSDTFTSYGITIVILAN